jgi:hypothetical protein
MLLQIPDHLSLIEFIEVATKVWTPLMWGLRMKKFEHCYDVRGWINYITKDYAKDEKCFDHQSTWFPVHQLTQPPQENLKNLVLLNIK